MQRMNEKEVVAKCHYDYMHVSIKKLLVWETSLIFASIIVDGLILMQNVFLIVTLYKGIEGVFWMRYVTT